jgi:hypothetical protein
MAIPHGAATKAGTRQITICNKGYARQRGRYVYFPIINLSGKWLKAHGFKSGQVIDITCEAGKLIITIAKEQRFEDI